MILPGFYIDVATWIDKRILAMTSEGPLVRAFLEGSLIWQYAAPEPLMYGRCAVHRNQFLSIHKGVHTGHAWLVGNGFARDLGPSGPGCSVLIDQHEAYVSRSAASFDAIGLISQPLPSETPVSATGFLDIRPDGTFWWADIHRTQTINGQLLHFPNERWLPNEDPVLVGQGHDEGIWAAYRGRNTRILGGEGYEPHLTITPDRRIGSCARTPAGAAFITNTLEDLS